MTTLTQGGQVEFLFFRRGVESVYIVGDFNSWNTRDLKMVPRGNGWWVASVRFEPGEYRFKYFADGDWFPDYAAQGIEFTKTGFNSILCVPERPIKQCSNSLAKQVA